MAEFAIALCLLLVACSEAQGSLLSTLTGSAASTLSSAVSDAEKQVVTVQKTAESVTNVTDTLTGMVTDVVKNANTQAIATGIATTAIAAVNSVQSNLLAKCETILAALRSFITLATGYLEKLESCGSNIVTFVSCIPLIIPSVESLISSVWTTLSADLSDLGDESASFLNPLSSSSLTTAMDKLEIEAEKSVTKVLACVSSLTSVASSFGR